MRREPWPEDDQRPEWLTNPDTLKPWERQAYDSPTSFKRFHRFYLSQEEPRSVNEAYRLWCKETQREYSRNTVATLIWRRWSWGQNYEGVSQPGALTWRQRATAFNDYLAFSEWRKWEARELEWRDAAWYTGGELQEKAMAFIEALPTFLKEHVDTEIDPDTGDPIKVITLALNTTINQLSTALKTALDLQRQAADIPEPVSRQALTDPTGEKPYDPIGNDYRGEILRRLLRIADAGDAGDADKPTERE